MAHPIYTIGHSNHSIEIFLSYLLDYQIDALVDVRSQPYSRRFPQFTHSALKNSLQKSNIEYVFLGSELGARKKNTDCYRDGRIRYDLLAEEPLFQKGMDRLMRGMKVHRIALMCAEKDPLYCHRAILVARRLQENGSSIFHILADGGIESHQQLEDRMLTQLKMPGTDLFRSREEILADAYNQHANNIA